MPAFKPPRPGEVVVDLPPQTDAGLVFIGEIRTPWPTPSDCPKNSAERAGIEARIEIFEMFRPGLKDVALFDRMLALYWLDRSRRDVIVQSPGHIEGTRGVFALRSPVRPNPIGLSVIKLVSVDATGLTITNIDCADRTPLVDLKPYFASTDAFPQARRP